MRSLDPGKGGRNQLVGEHSNQRATWRTYIYPAEHPADRSRGRSGSRNLCCRLKFRWITETYASPSTHAQAVIGMTRLLAQSLVQRAQPALYLFLGLPLVTFEANMESSMWKLAVLGRAA